MRHLQARKVIVDITASRLSRAATMHAHGTMQSGGQRCLHHVPFSAQPPRLCRSQRARLNVLASSQATSAAESATRPPWAGDCPK